MAPMARKVLRACKVPLVLPAQMALLVPPVLLELTARKVLRVCKVPLALMALMEHKVLPALTARKAHRVYRASRDRWGQKGLQSLEEVPATAT